MKKSFTTLFVAFMVIGLMSSCVSKKKFSELQSEKDALAAEMDQLRTDLEGQIKDLNDKNSSLESKNSSLSSDLSSVKGDLKGAKDNMMKMEASSKEMKGDLETLRGEINAAFSDVENAVTQSNQRITEVESMLYLDLEDDVNFRTASDAVSAEDSETLEQIATMLKDNPNLTLVVEGHADKRSISTDKYRDNWDLSTSRSTQVIRKLLKLGVNPEQLVASGRAEFAPAVTDDPNSKETLAANRRTEFVLLPNIGKLYKVFKSQKP